MKARKDHEPFGMRARVAGTLLACVTALIGAIGDCAAARLDGAAAAGPRTHRIFVLGSGYHTGLVVRARDVPQAAWPARRDFPDADYLELGWGAREYYRRVDPGISLAVRALFTPSASTLRAMPVAGSPVHVFRDSLLIELQLSPEGFQGLVEFVRRMYELDADGRAIVVPSEHRDGSRYYASPLTFHAFENCNVWTARALAAAGLPVRPETAVTADLLVHQVRPLGVALPAASQRAP